jgi:hypothetical protein
MLNPTLSDPHSYITIQTILNKPSDDVQLQSLPKITVERKTQNTRSTESAMITIEQPKDLDPVQLTTSRKPLSVRIHISNSSMHIVSLTQMAIDLTALKDVLRLQVFLTCSSEVPLVTSILTSFGCRLTNQGTIEAIPVGGSDSR